MHLRTLIVAGAALAAIVLALTTASGVRAAGGSPIAAYAFDEGIGTTARDSTTQGNTGTTRDTTWSASGKDGGALAFNGSSSWVTVPDSSSLDLTRAFTIEAWVKPSVDMGAAWETIAFKEQAGDPVYALYANSDTSAPAAVVSVPGSKADARGTSALTPNVWTHLATTWDGSSLRLYVNGTQVSSRQVSGTMALSAGPLRIGGNSVRGEWFSGLIDDVRIYSQSLSPGNIRNDMLTPVTPPSTPLPTDITPPSTPTGLAATNIAATSITATWTPSTDNVGVTAYNLFVDGVSAGSTASPVFTFSGLSCGTSYVLGVEALDAAGNTSGRQSITIPTVDCPDTSAPSAPTAFAAGATGTDSITASWTASTDNVGVAGYMLYRDGVSQGTTTGNVFTFAGLSCDTPYVLAVEAFDAAGNVSQRASVAAATAPCPDTTPPSAPAGLAANGATTTSIAAAWTASTDGVGVTGYTVYLDGASVGTTTSTSFAFTGLTCATSHELGVVAFDAAGNVSARTTITTSTSACPDTAAPSPPAGLAASNVTGSSLTASWNASTDNVGVTGYTVFQDGVSVGTTTTTSFGLAALSCGTSYVLGVQAFDAAGNVSARTAFTTSTAACPDTTAPSAPTGLAATSATATSIAASWTASADNVGVTGYTVFLDGASAGTTTSTSFTVTGLACGTSHTLAVQAFDAAGNVSARSSITASAAACAVDLIKPSAPTAFVATTVGKTSITMSWTASTDNVGVAGYNLYRSGVKQGTSSTTSFSYAGLGCNGAYSLGVEAFDAAGNVSARTTVTALTLPCPDAVAPSAPVGVVASSVNTTSIALSWTASTDNVGVTGYTVFRDGVNVGTTTSTTLTMSGLACGTSYLFGVQAFDAAGNNSTRTSLTLATAACLETVPPSAPSGLTTTATTSSLALSWTASTDNVGVTGYSVFLDGTSAGTTTTTSFAFSALGCGTSHTLGVQAFDASGNVSGRSTITAATATCPDTTAPSAPSGLTMTATTTSLALSWAASTDNVGVTGYSVFLDGASAGTTTTTSFTVTGLGCGTSHTLGVQAFDAAGNVSARTATTASTAACPDTTAPTAPTGLTATSAKTTSLAVSWTAATDNVAVTGYTVFLDGVSAGTTTTTSFAFTGLGCGTSHVLGVQAFDAAGNVSARAAVTASTVPCPDVTAPTTPTGLATTGITGTSIAVSWTPSTDNVGVKGYTLYRDGVNAGGATTGSFTFTGLTCGTGYVLGVEALDAAGNVSGRATITTGTASCPDTAPPSAPAGFGATTATGTTIGTSWSASTDNVGVAGYTLFLNGATVGTATATATSFGFAGLACGTSYTLGVQAFDAAGNVSTVAGTTASTSACPDTTPPSAPSSFIVSSAAATSIATSWAQSSDNVAVAGYTVYRNGTSVGTISGSSVATAASVTFTFAGLTCGTSYALGVEAFDAAGNVSARSTVTASTTACADTTPPTVSLTAPAAGATLTGTVQLTASASDATGVASVQFLVDGVNTGAPVTAAPYALSWNTAAAAPGTHTIAARAADASGNAATSAAVTVTVQNGLNTTNAFKKVDVGPGFMDAALHGVIRTAGGRVYIFSADDTAERKATGPGVIHAYRADQVGIPTSFTEVDAAHRPSATGTTHVVGAPDVRLAADGTAHMVYTDETNATLWYETFSTVTDTWGPRVSLATGVDVPLVAIKRETSNALVLDANDVPHVAYAGGGVVQYRDKVGGTWNAPVTVSSGGTAVHVGLAAAPDGTIDLSWLQGALAPSSIRFAQRSALGAWSAPETVASGDVLDNSNADQGPSVAYSATNEPYVLYVSALPTSAVRVRHRAGGAWTLDPTPSDFFTHTPQIYMQGNDVYAFLGHDSAIRFAYAYHLAGQPWSPLTALTTTADGTLDGSASIRWDPLHETNAGVIDATFWDEDQLNNKTYFPELYYMAVLPSGTGSTTTPPGPADSSAPTVSLTAPAAGATVSGTAVTVSANAADNVGVAGVQFKLDGANLGLEDTAAPYSISWDSTTVANGSHTLTAVARDAAGNTTTATSVTVSTSNTTPPPPAAGTVLVGNAATESKIDSDAAGEAEAFVTTAAVGGSVVRLRLFVDSGSTAGSIVLGLYTNNGGHPGALLTSGTITAPAAGQNNEVAVAAAPVSAGQTYWIAVLGRSGTVKFRDRGAVGSGNAELSGQVGLAALPATWTSGATFTDGLLSAVGLG